MMHFLEDGQSASRIPRWQARLRESRQETLTVLLHATKKTDVKPFLEEFHTLQTDFQGTVKHLSLLLKGYSGRMISPKTFFVSSEERQATYATVCRLLCGVEPDLQKLHRITALAVEHERTLLAQKPFFSAADCLLYEILQAAERERDGEAVERVERLESEVRRNRKQWEACVGDALLLRQTLIGLSGKTMPMFCERMSVAADLEHGGAGCDPGAVAGLYGELCAAIEACC